VASIKGASAKQLKEALGAQDVISLRGLPSQGPLDLLQLRHELAARLRSSGGRPSDPEWDLRRVIPLKQDRWDQLKKLAFDLSGGGREVSASQVAAVLLEKALESLETRERR
jgi:hypothetical protein